MRYLLSLLFPVPMRSTFTHEVKAHDVQAGGDANHFRDEDHHDLVTVRWIQWRGRFARQRTVSTCLPR